VVLEVVVLLDQVVEFHNLRDFVEVALLRSDLLALEAEARLQTRRREHLLPGLRLREALLVLMVLLFDLRQLHLLQNR